MTTDTSTAGDATRQEAGCPDCTDGLGKPTAVSLGSWRHRIRSNPGTALAWRIGVFIVGLLFIALGIALAVLPGPLTIPPVLLGLWVWSTEFNWAKRFFDTFRQKAQEAWRHAKQHPASSIAITVGGLAAVAATIWAIQRYQLVDRAMQYLGLQ